MTEVMTDPWQAEINQFQDAILGAQHVTFEIGTGLNPLPRNLGPHHFDEGNVYVGWNIDSRQHRYYTERLMGNGCLAVHVPIEESERLLDIVPSNSVDEAVAINVLGERPGLEHYLGTKINPSTGQLPKYLGATPLTQKFESLRLARELIKPGGQIVLIETYTPWNGSQHSSRLLAGDDSRLGPERLLEEAGFVNIVTTGDETPIRFRTALMKYSVAYGMSSFSYLVVGEKPATSQN